MRKFLLIPVLLLALLAALFLILPKYIPHTEEPVLDRLVEKMPDDTEETDHSEEIPVPSPEEALVGEYVLTALFSGEQRFSEPDLAVLRERGVPLGLTVRDDGTASLSIFDIQAELEVNTDAMFFFRSGQPFPFFFEDGILTVWDSGSRAVFQKCA